MRDDVRLKGMWMWRVRDGTVAFHSTSENNLSNCNLLFYFVWVLGSYFSEMHHPLFTAYKIASQADKKAFYKTMFKKTRMNILTQTYS